MLIPAAIVAEFLGAKGRSNICRTALVQISLRLSFPIPAIFPIIAAVNSVVPKTAVVDMSLADGLHSKFWAPRLGGE